MKKNISKIVKTAQKQKKSAPANAENNIVSIRKQVHTRTLKALKDRLSASLDKDIIKEYEETTGLRTISIHSYGNHTVDLGEKTITRGKDKKEVTVRNIIKGTEAIAYIAKSLGYNVILTEPKRIYINADKKNVLDIYNRMKQYGRVYIYCWQYEHVDEKKDKKPTNNTTEKKIAAKKARKQSKKSGSEMRPYYAALRKGCVSKRIKVHNKTLAEKIEKWLKEKKATDAKKNAAKEVHDAEHRQLTTKRVNSLRKLKKIQAHKKKIKALQAREKTAMANNIANKQKAAQKQSKQTQQQLNLAA